MKRISLAIALALGTIATMPAYAGVLGSEDTGSSVVKTDARKVNRVLKGTVVQATEANIEESSSAKTTGIIAGVATGASIGSSGRGGLIGGTIGAVVGGLGGAIAMVAASSQTAQDIIIQVDGGDLINITQAVDDKVGKFAEGDNVMIVYKGDSGRVLRAKGAAKPGAEVAPAAVPVAETTPLPSAN
jgi:outer membrane lipoprotein SlyB